MFFGPYDLPQKHGPKTPLWGWGKVDSSASWTKIFFPYEQTQSALRLHICIHKLLYLPMNMGISTVKHYFMDLRTIKAFRI